MRLVARFARTDIRAARLLAIAVLVAVMADPAFATETVACTAADDFDALVEMNLGAGVPTENPNWVRVSVGDKGWSTLGLDTELTPVSLRQSFDDGRSLSIDLTDPAVERIAIQVRILRAEEGEKILRVGYVHILGQSLHPILCDFGDSE